MAITEKSVNDVRQYVKALDYFTMFRIGDFERGNLSASVLEEEIAHIKALEPSAKKALAEIQHAVLKITQPDHPLAKAKSIGSI
jgi:hypothetical protein